MAAVTTDQIKELREMTGAGMMDCKRTLEETGGDIKKAADALRSKGLAKAAKRMDRTTGVGRIFSYIHGEGNIGVLLQLNCETDFVARNDDFGQLGKDLCMQIAAQAPLAVTAEEIPEEEVVREKQVVEALLKEEGKKPEQIEKIVPGKLKKFYSEVALLEQPYIKDPKSTVQDLIKEAISKFGENITVGRFTRYQVG